MASKETIEHLLEDLGGCGLFQTLTALLIHGSCMAPAWAVLYMAFASYNPGWTCLDSETFNDTSTVSYGNGSSGATDEELSSCEAFENCKNVFFNNGTSTIVTEWNLMCSRHWIASMIISLHMAGVLVGALTAGHLSHYFGRKRAHYGMLLLHSTIHVVAMFASDWPMYAGLRFVLGATTGSTYLSGYVYPVEFVVNKWRGAFSAIPVTCTGYLIFSITAMFLRDWKKLHLATAIFTFVWFLPVVWVPESLHWLTIKGKILKAHRVVQKAAKMNKTQAPNTDVIAMIAQHEKKVKQSSIYTILDLYRHGFLARTFILSIAWICCSLVYYTMMFGVRNLSGNFYVNLMAFSCLVVISYPLVPLMSNTVGRRWGMIVLFSIAILCYVGLIVLHFYREDFDEGLIVMIVSLLSVSAIDGVWVFVVLVTVELYPTGLRTLSFSHASCLARIGGMVAPFIIPEEQRSVLGQHIAMGLIILVTCGLIFYLPETRGQPMIDSMKAPNQPRNASEEIEAEMEKL